MRWAGAPPMPARPTPRRGCSGWARSPGSTSPSPTSWFLIVALIAILIAPRIEDVAPGLGGWAYLAGLAFAVLLYMSVLLHEMSHALAARAFEMPVRLDQPALPRRCDRDRGGGRPRPWREFVIAVVGPAHLARRRGLALLAASTCSTTVCSRYAVVSPRRSPTSSSACSTSSPGCRSTAAGCCSPSSGAITGNRRSRRRSSPPGVAGSRPSALIAVPVRHAAGVRLSSRAWSTTCWPFMIAAFLWAGATQALAVAKLRSRLPALQARRLARPAIGVPADLPLAEAIRRAQEASAGSVVVVPATDEPAGIVNEAAVSPPRRTAVPGCPSVTSPGGSRTGLLLPADLVGRAAAQGHERHSGHRVRARRARRLASSACW